MERADEYRLEIVTGRYQAASAAQREMLRVLFGESAAQDYEIYFHWYNILHELGHAVMMFHAAARPHPAQEEQLVNDFAVAYWRHYAQPQRLERLGEIVRRALRRLPAPAADHLEYAKARWDTEEMRSFEGYGWFQFSSVRQALGGEKSFAQALRDMGVHSVCPQARKALVYDLDDETACRVLADACKTLKSWGVRLPDEARIVFCDDINCHMCRAIRADGLVW